MSYPIPGNAGYACLYNILFMRVAAGQWHGCFLCACQQAVVNPCAHYLANVLDLLCLLRRSRVLVVYILIEWEVSCFSLLCMLN